MPKKKPGSAPLVTTGQAQTPDGRLLELVVTARPFDGADSVPLWKSVRDVRLYERDPSDPAARSMFMLNNSCPIATVKRIVLWAEMLHVPIVFDPPGNLEGSFSFAPEPKPERAKKSAPAKSAFDSLL